MTDQERLQRVIYRMRWIEGIKNAEMVSDEAISKAIIEAGFTYSGEDA